MQIKLDTTDIEPLIEACISRMLDRFDDGSRLLYSEAEAAAMYGVARHVLRDERLKGNLKGCKVGSKIRYSRQSLIEFIREREGRT